MDCVFFKRLIGNITLKIGMWQVWGLLCKKNLDCLMNIQMNLI